MPNSSNPDKRSNALPGQQAAGDSVYLISPAGAIDEEAPYELALQQLCRHGWLPRPDPAVKARWQRFAGTDKQRLSAVERAARQNEADMVMMTRGGYGWMRLLPKLCFTTLAEAGKFWVGYSDTTAFHLAMLGTTASITWAGPMLLDDFGRSEVDETSSGCLREAYAGELEALGFRYKSCKTNSSTIDEAGILWGGNLSMVCAMIGSPWLKKAPQGGILFLEDIGEHPYRIERMLLSLLYGGIIDAQNAVLLGAFNGYKLGPHDQGYDLQKVFRWIATQTKVPLLEGLPFGHHQGKVSLPHGMHVGLATEGRQAFLLFDQAHR